MKDKLKGVECILFDLGGVIINIDWKLSVYAFSELTGNSFEELNRLMRREELVQKIETGEMNPEDFRNWFKNYFQTDFHNLKIDKAWNAMLLDIPQERVKIIENLRKNYQVMCLSNTNDIHIKELNKRLLNVSKYKNLEVLMDKTYYSHNLKTRKPDPQAWKIILDENQFSPESVLYFDDNETNHQIALEMGINSILISPDYTIEKYFNE